MPGNFVNNYFGFNKQQRNGLLVLCCISFALLVIRITYPQFIKPDPMIIKDLAMYEDKLASAPASPQSASSDNMSRATESGKTKLFVFDPNLVSYEQLLLLGFKEKTAGVFIKFRKKGFVFKHKEDLKKVYGISNDFYDQLQPYILIQSPLTSSGAEARKMPLNPIHKTTITQKIELNAADSTALLSLPGIGSSYAKRIIKYRTLLGGYSEVAQLKEVYGFSEELYEKIRELVFINPDLIHKIDLNKDDFKVINKHPYISYELTKSVVEWRRKTVLTEINFKDLLNDPSLYSKLLPYLAFNR